MEILPGPAMSRKIIVIICAYSERVSCNTAQIPTWGGEGGRGRGEVPKYKDILVVAIATSISKMKGIEMSRVRNPMIKRSPPMISRPATKWAITSGAGMPSFVKRPTP
jgi:hypothetical protein